MEGKGTDARHNLQPFTYPWHFSTRGWRVEEGERVCVGSGEGDFLSPFHGFIDPPPFRNVVTCDSLMRVGGLPHQCSCCEPEVSVCIDFWLSCCPFQVLQTSCKEKPTCFRSYFVCVVLLYFNVMYISAHGVVEWWHWMRLELHVQIIWCSDLIILQHAECRALLCVHPDINKNNTMCHLKKKNLLAWALQ